MVFKCKMCGGELEIVEGGNVCTCMYCGTKQTLPHNLSEKRANMYDRANYFRRVGEYDKAEKMYERILEEDGDDAEAYWSLVLCRYGVEYVEDPDTKRRVITCNRTQFGSVFADNDYQAALEHATDNQKEVLKAEAAEIDKIQKGILAIAEQEEAFDVFICYKETDAQGKQTQDSVLAEELYRELTEVGLRVFFARITLEEKPGTAYEPYIFAALHSAKVMVVVGTKPEYLNAVWVKNEWSRYLSLIKKGEKKILIPAYKDMNPYELPEEMAYLQAMDMSKMGFLSDPIRTVQKNIAPPPKTEPVRTETPRTVVKAVHQEESVHVEGNVEALLDRGYFALEDGDWANARKFFESVLNLDARNGKAYIGLLLAEVGVSKLSGLKYSHRPIENSRYFGKAVQFSDDADRKLLEESKVAILQGIEERKKSSIYSWACEKCKSAKSEDLYAAMKNFEALGGYKDSAEKIKECEQKIEAVGNKEKKIVRNIFIAFITVTVIILTYSFWASRKLAAEQKQELLEQEAQAEKIWEDLEDTTWFIIYNYSSDMLHIEKQEVRISTLSTAGEIEFTNYDTILENQDGSWYLYLTKRSGVGEQEKKYEIEFDKKDSDSVITLQDNDNKMHVSLYSRDTNLSTNEQEEVHKAANFICGIWTITALIKNGEEITNRDDSDYIGTLLTFCEDRSIEKYQGIRRSILNKSWRTDGEKYYIQQKNSNVAAEVMKYVNDRWEYTIPEDNITFILEKNE